MTMTAQHTAASCSEPPDSIPLCTADTSSTSHVSCTNASRGGNSTTPHALTQLPHSQSQHDGAWLLQTCPQLGQSTPRPPRPLSSSAAVHSDMCAYCELTDGAALSAVSQRAVAVGCGSRMGDSPRLAAAAPALHARHVHSSHVLLALLRHYRCSCPAPTFFCCTRLCLCTASGAPAH